MKKYVQENPIAVRFAREKKMLARTLLVSSFGELSAAAFAGGR